MKQFKPLITIALITLFVFSAMAQPMRGARSSTTPDSSYWNRPNTVKPRQSGMLPPPAVLDQLALRADQKEKLRLHALEIRRQRAEIVKEIELAQSDLEEVLTKWPIDKNKLAKSTDKLSEKRKELSQLHFSSLTFLVGLLDKEQHEKFRELHLQKGLFQRGQKPRSPRRGGVGGRTGAPPCPLL